MTNHAEDVYRGPILGEDLRSIGCGRVFKYGDGCFAEIGGEIVPARYVTESHSSGWVIPGTKPMSPRIFEKVGPGRFQEIGTYDIFQNGDEFYVMLGGMQASVKCVERSQRGETFVLERNGGE